jgi:hypothetical protein
MKARELQISAAISLHRIMNILEVFQWLQEKDVIVSD